MITYKILANPGHNRVYFESSAPVSLAELELACRTMQTSCGEIRREVWEGIPYFSFSAEERLSDLDLEKLSRLSFSYALFEQGAGGGDREGQKGLFPISKIEWSHLPPSLSTILKYTGKTNELFTRTMINTAVFSSDFAKERELYLLDPIAGKGTTLFEGLICGYRVSGIEIGEKAVHEMAVYFKKFLETEKYKHTFQKERFSGANRSFTSQIYRFELADSKENFKDAGKRQSLIVAAGDSRYANQYYRKNSFHILVGDLPYGVAHGNVTNERGASRNPKELLRACLPAWREVLKPGGAMALAWNTFVLPREELEKLVEEHGFSVLKDGPYCQFEHRVDQAIRRDLLVARK